MASTPVSFFWYRRDLRLHDNAGLYHALKDVHPVIPVFIFDKNILDKLLDKDDARVTFIYQAIEALKAELREKGSDILVKYGHPEEVWQELMEEYTIQAVYTNRDYEQYALQRDQAVKDLLKEKYTPLYTFKDHVIFEQKEVVKDDGDPYTVFTPYSKKWKEKLHSRKENGELYYFKSYPVEKYSSRLHVFEASAMPALEEMGFRKNDMNFPPKTLGKDRLEEYDKLRNYPATDGTSRLSVHYRFGTISIREKARKALKHSDTYLNELIWRDFYSMILYNFPHVEKEPFREKYGYIQWRNDQEEFEAWCLGKTGYPIVDAGMRQLNATGFMHNRLRMIVASFLTKHLLIDWRWGEAYFARKLLDYELSSNNGGWQWAAGSGTDAAPYFRIFNPWTQREKFDKNYEFIKKWVPEYDSAEYPNPIVEHKFARERCLEVYKAGLDRAHP